MQVSDPAGEIVKSPMQNVTPALFVLRPKKTPPRGPICRCRTMDVKPAFCAGVAPTAGCDRRRRSGQSGLESALPGRFVVAFDFWLQRQPRANDPHASIRYWVGSWGGRMGRSIRVKVIHRSFAASRGKIRASGTARLPATQAARRCSLMLIWRQRMSRSRRLLRFRCFGWFLGLLSRGVLG